MRASLFFEPIAELSQLLGGGQIGPKRLVKLAIRRAGQQADLHRLLRYLYSSAVGVEDFHSNAPVLFFRLMQGYSGLEGEKRSCSSA
jgi:hypothetical protein